MMLHLHFVLLLLLTSVIGPEPEVTQHYRKGLVCDDIVTEIENREVACEIERAFREEGFEDPLIRAALLNSYAESKFNPKAVGDNGNSKGVFQLNIKGLGSRMTDKEKHDVRSSVRRVAIAIRKSPKLTKAIKDGEGSKKLTELFCTEIMRPSHKFEKARARGRMDEKLFRTPAAERGFSEGRSKS